MAPSGFVLKVRNLLRILTKTRDRNVGCSPLAPAAYCDLIDTTPAPAMDSAQKIVSAVDRFGGA